MTNTIRLRKDIEVLRRKILPNEDAQRSKQIHLLLQSNELLLEGNVEESEKLRQLYKENEPPCSSEITALLPKYEDAIKRSAIRNLPEEVTKP